MWLNVPPGPMFPESKNGGLSLDVTVCVVVGSLFVHLTVSPTVMVTLEGENPVDALTIDTFVVAASAGRANAMPSSAAIPSTAHRFMRSSYGISPASAG